ncbi:SGNH/GDSL hydrolase family protein [Clostridium sp. Sa3CUN1]|uniref:SGNH/GDSL hydrolase family protein n=1 Tax=Clostridium gallinarum TaxID=2762246 RepID=A0ABR8Q2P4_9CLOT|nr:SGNH/GDSL hydrolase family protein [Clostridium gallinarum]MBD7914689.1 SGNH/GDSL hydrolase family protein [Clostridium gallinarum]
MEYITQEMINNSLVSKGDIKRIANLIDKAERGQDITIAFLGGSITQGCNATKKENCYVNRTYSWFKNTFKDINIKCINAGVGATGSIIGVHRVEKQVLAYNPDIIFIDFAVNDKNNIYDKIAYESLIRRILSTENQPAIIEVFMSNFDGSNVQEQQIEIGKKYKISMISFRDTVQKEIENGKIKWEDVATDEVHPNDYGHFIISELLINFIKNVSQYSRNEVENKIIELGSPIFGENYINGEIKNNKEVNITESNGIIEDPEGFQVFNNGWKSSRVKDDNSILKVNLKGKNIFLLYKKSIKETSGKIQVSIDGNTPFIIDTYFENGWGDYSETKLLISDKESDNHTIEIKLIDDEVKNEIYIMGFLVS